ncbi:nuclear cap-binding protein subunit 1 [Planococcus citri]|uniref:nuclear cap-binding protein subunit 1 n=1 Tax=Planococcus citri TaxID=170843 RepID=UPI0031F89559
MSRRRQFEETEDGYERLCKKRRKVSENQDIEDRLGKLILEVGEKNTNLESNLQGLASVLEGDLGTFRAKVLRILTDCAIKIPEKCTIYSTLVGLLNVKNYNFGGEFVEHMVRNLKDNLKSCNWNSARYCLRFLADLVNCHVISASSLLSLFENLLDVVKEEGVPMVRKDWYAYAVLSCLPWVGRELYEKKEQNLNMMLATIEVYLNKRSKKHLGVLRVWSTDNPHPQEEYLDCLWAQINKLRQDNWTENHILRPYLAFDNILCEALQHNIPLIIPPPHHPSYKYPMPWVVFRMFDYTDCPEGPILPGAHAIERYLIEEHLHQIIELYHFERKECAQQLMNFPYKLNIPLEYCVIEVIFAELLSLPAPRYIEIFYASLLLELCKLKPFTVPQVLAQATEMFFFRLENMNVACFDRLVTWFGYHLSNFKFSFAWDDWEASVKFHPEHPQPKFIREVLLKTMRLSYHQRICDMVPKSYAQLLPEKPEPKYKYSPDNSSEVEGVQYAQTLSTAIRQKSPEDQIINILKDIPNPLLMESSGDMEPRCNPLQIDVFAQTLLFLGAKSFTHSFVAINRYYEVLKWLAESEEAQLCVLRSIFELWRTHQQMLIVLIDKLLKNQILDCSSVANWIFSKEMSSEFTKLYVWEILYLTINKMSKHVNRLTKELTEMREKVGHTNGSSDSEDEEPQIKTEEKITEEMVEKMEEKLESAQGDQKNLFLIIFQRFIMILGEHLVRCDTDGISHENYWYKWTIGRLQQVFLAHHDQVQKYSGTLETLLFTQDLDPHILEVFHQFLSLRG